MDEKYVQSLIATLQNQRDGALNALAQVEARLRVLEAEKQQNSVPEDAPLADKVV